MRATKLIAGIVFSGGRPRARLAASRANLLPAAPDKFTYDWRTALFAEQAPPAPGTTSPSCSSTRRASPAIAHLSPIDRGLHRRPRQAHRLRRPQGDWPRSHLRPAHGAEKGRCARRSDPPSAGAHCPRRNRRPRRRKRERARLSRWVPLENRPSRWTYLLRRAKNATHAQRPGCALYAAAIAGTA